MSIPTFATHTQIRDRLESYFPEQWQAGRTGRVTKRLITAFSLALASVYAAQARILRLSIVATSEGEALRELVAGWGMSTIPGQRASVEVRFERYHPGPAIAIPSGTQAQTIEGVRFATASDALLPENGLTVDILCFAVTPGSSGNVPSGAIAGVSGVIEGIDRVTNFLAAAGGTDGESDTEIKERVPNHLESKHRATIAAVEYAIAQDKTRFPDVAFFRTERQYGQPGYFRGIVSDIAGGDLYRPKHWQSFGGGVYFTDVNFAFVYGLVQKGWPCRRFGEISRNPDGEEVWGASSDPFAVQAGNYRWYFDTKTRKLYAKADGQDLGELNLTLYAGMVWRVLREIEVNWAANGVFVDVVVPSRVVADIEVSYQLMAGYSETEVSRNLRTAIAGYARSRRVGDNFTVNGVLSELARADGAIAVRLESPTTDIEVGRDDVFRVGEITIRRR
jgi:uncharacterized phage protein gp47/JayE